VHLLLHVFAARGGYVEAAPQERRQLGTISALRLLHGHGEPLEEPADFQREIGIERHIHGDRRKGQDGRTIGAEELQPVDHGRLLKQLLTDEEQRGGNAHDAHGKADGAAGHALDRLLHALIDVVGRRDGRSVGVPAAVLQVEVRVVRIEQRFIELAVQPATPLAMQGRRDQVSDAYYAGILEEDEQDKQSGAVQQIRQRRRVAGIVEEGDRVDQLARGLGHPDAGFAGDRREQRDHRRQRPSFHPALGEPVGSHQAPEAAHRGNRRQRWRFCAAVPTRTPET
jgi:hypothetical protein